MWSFTPPVSVLAADMSLRRLHGHVAQQKLNLLKLTTSGVAHLWAQFEALERAGRDLYSLMDEWASRMVDFRPAHQ
jgi:hypothetical protein